MKKTIYIVTEGFKLKAKRKRFTVTIGKQTVEWAAVNLNSIIIAAKEGTISTRAILLSYTSQTPIITIDTEKQTITPLPQKPGNIENTIQQYTHLEQIDKETLRKARIKNINRLLKTLKHPEIYPDENIEEAENKLLNHVEKDKKGFKQAYRQLQLLLQAEATAALQGKGIDLTLGLNRRKTNLPLALDYADIYTEPTVTLTALQTATTTHNMEAQAALKILAKKLDKNMTRKTGLTTIREMIYRQSQAFTSYLTNPKLKINPPIWPIKWSNYT